MTTVADIVSTMKSKFNASAAAGLDLVFQFNIEDGDNHYLVVKRRYLRYRATPRTPTSP